MKNKFVLIIFILSFGNTAFAQIQRYQAAYIYNFAQQLEWPKSYKSGNFIIAVYGNDKVVSHLKNIAATKTIKGQKIEVAQYLNSAQIKKAHILYVPTKYSKHMATIKSKIGNNSTLLIGNGRGSIAKGAAINFMTINNKLRFEISKSNALKQNIKVSATLLKLASKKH